VNLNLNLNPNDLDLGREVALEHLQARQLALYDAWQRGAGGVVAVAEAVEAALERKRKKGTFTAQAPPQLQSSRTAEMLPLPVPCRAPCPAGDETDSFRVFFFLGGRFAAAA
jgi:hypothetical protein